jgi:hypothetical protein
MLVLRRFCVCPVISWLHAMWSRILIKASFIVLCGVLYICMQIGHLFVSYTSVYMDHLRA